MHRDDLNEQIEILEDCSDSDWEVIVQDASCVVDDKKLNASSNPILSQTTDPSLHYEFTAPYQGSAGMQNYRNYASSSHHKGGFSTAEEIVSNLASQPQDTSTGYPVNAQGVQSSSNFHPPTNGVSGRDSSQSNYSQSNYNPIVTESSQINNGPHPYFPAAQHASNAVDDSYSPSQLEADAYNSPTTGPLPHGYPVPQQGLAGMQNDCNLASTSQYLSAVLQENVPNFTSQLPVMSTHSLNNDFGDPTSLFSNLMTEYSPNDDGLLEQIMASHNFVSSKILTMSDIRLKPTLPTQIVNHMSPFMNGSHFLDLKAADILGKEWSLCFYTRPNGIKKCPVFTTGWHQYVEAKNVRIGDRLIFSGRQVAAADGKLP
ncbi:hypothetical protein QYF36_015459 [Acer negundo]|nr:hypothetical protein QYF36_015459 [Acer negundo]